MNERDYTAQQEALDALLETDISIKFIDWEGGYNLERLDLAYSVTKVLLDHLHEKQSPEVISEWCRKTAEILWEQAGIIDAITEQDCQKPH